jgi:hypothetical protein
LPDYTSAETSAGQAALTAAEVRDLYDDLSGVFAGRNADYAASREYYEGQHWDGSNLVAKNGRYSLVVNYLRPIVQSTVRDLTARMPGIQVFPRDVDPGNRRLAENCEALLYGTWEYNEAQDVFRDLAFNSYLLGRAWLYYWWDAKAMRVRFISAIPDNVFPVFDNNEVVEILHVTRRLTRVLKRQYPSLASQITEDEATDALVGRTTRGPASVSGGIMDALDGSGGYLTDPRVHAKGYTTVLDWFDRDGNWTRVMGDAVHTQKLGYGTGRVPFIPFVAQRTGDGGEPASGVTDVIELNQYLDQLFSQQADIIAKYSNPTILDEATGQPGEAIKRAVQGDGAVLPIKLGSTLKFLNWDGPTPAIDQQLERALSFIYDISGRPASSFGQTVTNQSGVMTNLSLTPTTASAEDRMTLFGESLSRFNSDVLRLYEKFAAGEKLEFSGWRDAGRKGQPPVRYSMTEGFKGKDIDGWYANEIKWPSVLRTDDPVYVQNELAKMTSQPPVQSVYTTLENLGIEDVEAELDRIGLQLEDPRFNPQGLETAMNVSRQLQDSLLPPDIGPALDPTSTGALGLGESLEAAGNPNRDALPDLRGPGS